MKDHDNSTQNSMAMGVTQKRTRDDTGSVRWVALVMSCVCVTSAQGADDIGALGRLTPRDDVLYLAGTPGAVVQEVLVRPDDVVERGATLMVFSNHELLEAELELAQIEHEQAKKNGVLQLLLQKLALEAGKLNLERAKEQLKNYEALGANAIVDKELISRRYQVDDAAIKVRVEETRLQQLRQQIEILQRQTKARLRVAESNLQDSILTSPVDGTILQVHTQAGELVSDHALVMADTSTMYVSCEVYEGDILRIKPGMSATVNSSALPDELTGVVERVGKLVNTETKLAEVLVRLDGSDIARDLIGMEVNVNLRP